MSKVYGTIVSVVHGIESIAEVRLDSGELISVEVTPDDEEGDRIELEASCGCDECATGGLH